MENAEPRVITSDDGNYAFIVDTTVLVSAFPHDYEDRHSASVSRLADGRIVMAASDPTNHATIYLQPNEARMFAQAILDAAV